jgi:hypothetical protein
MSTGSHAEEKRLFEVIKKTKGFKSWRKSNQTLWEGFKEWVLYQVPYERVQYMLEAGDEKTQMCFASVMQMPEKWTPETLSDALHSGYGFHESDPQDGASNGETSDEEDEDDASPAAIGRRHVIQGNPSAGNNMKFQQSEENMDLVDTALEACVKFDSAQKADNKYKTAQKATEDPTGSKKKMAQYESQALLLANQQTSLESLARQVKLYQDKIKDTQQKMAKTLAEAKSLLPTTAAMQQATKMADTNRAELAKVLGPKTLDQLKEEMDTAMQVVLDTVWTPSMTKIAPWKGAADSYKFYVDSIESKHSAMMKMHKTKGLLIKKAKKNLGNNAIISADSKIDACDKKTFHKYRCHKSTKARQSQQSSPAQQTQQSPAQNTHTYFN